MESQTEGGFRVLELTSLIICLVQGESRTDLDESGVETKDSHTEFHHQYPYQRGGQSQ